ncbi:MAG: hypothetical protein LT106_06500 [Burkholderiaceae bacterium]|nr:hypothetical protein [Burkholderiaceae bacterium]
MKDSADDTRHAEFFQLLESLAHEAFRSRGMQQHQRSSRYLAALSVLSRCLAETLRALSRVHASREMLGRESDPRLRALLEAELAAAEHDRALAELELRAVSVPLYALAGAFGDRTQAALALRTLSEDVESDEFRSVFPRSAEIDALLPMATDTRAGSLKAG